MKIQDILAAGIIVFLLRQAGAKIFVYAGLLCYLLAVPLFSRWIFFTAERLVWYGTLCILIAIVRYTARNRRQA